MGAKRVSVVAGGAGFIGSHLVDALTAKGHTVVVVDNFVTGRKENVAHVTDVDILDHDIAQREIPIEKADYIFHLASPASPVDFTDLAEEIAHVNAIGTMNLLTLAKKTSAKFLLASTSEVYGDPKEHPQKETYWGNVNPVGPRACYDESKRFAEMITTVATAKHSLDARIVRIFNTYGPRMRPDDGRVVSNFITQAISGKPLTVYGDGTQTRSFCFVSDMVDGLMAAMFTNNTRGEVFNVGNPDEHTIANLAATIQSMTKNEKPVQRVALPQDDPTRRKPDITKANTMLGWSPKVGISDGLTETIAYYRALASS